MELGPIQKKWIQALKDNPEQQHKSSLGIKLSDGSFQFCCLGKGLEILKGSESLVWWHDNLTDSEESSDDVLTCLSNSYSLLGLRSSAGDLLSEAYVKDEEWCSLACMNDHGLTWLEIAEFMEKRPELVFERSV